MPRVPFEKELFYSSCLDTPKWVADRIERIQKEQELSLMRELYSVPQIKINTENFNIDYFKEPWVTCGNYIKPFSMVKLEKETNKMEAKKCDRCGKLYETESANDTINVLFKQEKVSEADKERYSEFHNNEMRTHNISIKRGNCGGQVDFCPECRESFKKWFEG